MRARFWLPLSLLALAASVRAGETYSHQSAKEVQDLGVIESFEEQEASKPKFRASVQTRAEFTTNAKMSGDHSSGDLIFFPQIEVGMNVPLGHKFSFDIAARTESGLYTQTDERSYIGYSIISTLDWRPKIDGPRIFIGAEPYRYDSFDTGDKITQAVGLSAGTDWGFAFDHGYSMAFIGYTFTDYLADPSIDNRTTHKATVGVSHQFNAKLTGTMFYQFSYSDYSDVDRRDYRHLVGASLLYQFRENLFGTFTTSFADLDSTQDLASYQGFSLSLGLNLAF